MIPFFRPERGNIISAVAARREVWRDEVPPSIFFSARIGGEAADAGGKKEHAGGSASPHPTSA
jgi:hypothetical protein